MKYTFTNVEIESAGLKVTATDATNEYFPTNTSAGTPDEEGKQFYYRPVKKRETKWDLYCTKLGAALARELKKANKNTVIQHDALIDLPKGYQLFEHVKNYIHEPKKYRTDTYLFGFGSIKFRSPAEFEDHLLWLASDQSTNCICKYCSRDSTPKMRPTPKRTPQRTPQRTSQRTSQQTPQQTPQRTPQKSSRAVTPSSSIITTPSQVVLYSKSKTQISDKVVQLPSDTNHYSRNGEIVWIKTSLILSESYLEELRKSKVKMEHWPGYIVERQKFSQVVNNVASASGTLIDNLYYKVQPLNVVGTQKASEEQVVPWLLLSSENLVEKIYKIRDDHAENRGSYSPTLIRVINLFCSACDTAKRISKTYTPLDFYNYTLPPLFLLKIEDSNERRLLEEMERYSHYKSLCFGTEILKEDDYVRMNDDESKGENIRIFKINTIYKKDNKVLFNGDIYLKSFAKGDKVSWSRLNDEDREYFIELKEISGRYYDKCPYVNKSMEVNEEISFNERKELIEANRSKPDPSQPVIGKQTAKRSVYFDNPSNNPPKKLKIQNGNTTPQKKILKQNNQQEKIDPIIISPTIPILDEPEDEISETESNLFEMLSNHPENPQHMSG